jgi:hypothetical protein
MPTATCSHCGHEFQYPDSFAGSSVQCPRGGCGKPVLLPNLDGTMPVDKSTLAPPPLPPRAGPSASYYLRHPDAPELVVGPLPRDRVKRMAQEGKVKPGDELSPDQKDWRTAERIDPELFGLRPKRLCRVCGAWLDLRDTQCPTCDEPCPPAPEPVVAAPAAPPGKLLLVPEPLTDFVSAHAADAVVAVNRDGWLGLLSAETGKLRRVWRFDRGSAVQLAVADKGRCAVLAVQYRLDESGAKVTRLYLADFDLRRLEELAELDGRVRELALDAKGRRLALVDDKPDVRLYQMDPFKRVDKIPVEGSRFAFDLEGDRLAAAGDDGRIDLWDLRSGKLERELYYKEKGAPACPQRPLRMAFSTSGTRLFAACGESARVGPPAAGAPAPATAGHSAALRCWNVERGKLTAEFGDIFAVHPTGVADAAFWPWGTTVATVGQDRVHAWDISTGADLGAIHIVPNADESGRGRGSGDSPTMIRRVDFTRDGEEALILVAGTKEIQMVPWPKPRADDQPDIVDQR